VAIVYHIIRRMHAPYVADDRTQTRRKWPANVNGYQCSLGAPYLSLIQ